MKDEKYETTMQHCRICQQNTQHEIRSCESARVRICVRCLARASGAVMQVADRRATGGAGEFVRRPT